jgi:hypothetical protein
MTIDELTASNITTVPESYVAGEAELETIARAIEHSEILIDKLSLAVKRADFLNRHLEQQLVGIERTSSSSANKRRALTIPRRKGAPA